MTVANSQYCELTLHIQFSSIGDSVSKAVVRHTSVFSTVHSAHIPYSKFFFI